MTFRLFNYQAMANRESSLYLKNNTKIKNNVVVSKYVPPPIISEENSFVPQQTTSLINNSMARVKQPQRNPLRHYRRQLTIDTADINTHNVSKYIHNDFNLPGKAIVVNNKDSCYDCLDNNNAMFFKQEIYPNNETFNQGKRYYDASNNLSKCIACNPETNVIKTASTLLDKSYCSSNREFLRKRCKTYDQNIYCKTSQCIPGQHSGNCNTQCSNNIPSNDNINNAIGGVSVTAYQYGKFYRNINGIYTVLNNGKCKQCNYPILYKKNGQTNCCKCCPLNNPNPSIQRRKCRF